MKRAFWKRAKHNSMKVWVMHHAGFGWVVHRAREEWEGRCRLGEMLEVDAPPVWVESFYAHQTLGASRCMFCHKPIVRFDPTRYELIADQAAKLGIGHLASEALLASKEG